MRFLRNLTAEVILIVGIVVLGIIALPFILIEILFRTHILGWLILAGIIYVIVRLVQASKK